MIREEKRLRPGLNAAVLRWLALGLMLIDHIWLALLRPGHIWMTFLGRLAFPIFAFQIAQGCVHTSDFKRYALRLFLFGVISEIPYNMFLGGAFIVPGHQNVMFTLTLGLLILRLCLWAARNGKQWAYLLAVAGVAAAYALADLCCFSYGGLGVLTVVMFGLTDRLSWRRVAQTICLAVIMFGLVLKAGTLGFPYQLFGVLAMIPISLYNEKPGPKNKLMQYASYLFYPAHIGVLVVVRYLLAKLG